MNTIPEELYTRIKKVSDKVRQNLLLKGVVVPIKNKNGTISIGHFTIVKENNGSFSILDYSNEIMVKHINLPQTAILVSNKLALGLYKDTELLEMDRKYGSADFEEELYKRALNRKNSNVSSLYVSRYDDAKL